MTRRTTMKKVRVAMCWDDGVFTDVKAIAIFKAHKAKATFNLCPGLAQNEDILPRWIMPGQGWSHNGVIGGKVGLDNIRKVYGDFQVASHCWKHEVAGRCPHAEFMEGAIKAREWLENTFQRQCTGFAWPCGGVTPEAIADLKAAGFTYGRSTKNVSDLTENKDVLDLASNCHFMARDFIDRYENAKKNCGLFYFWGHTYEMMDYDRLYEQLDAKIKYISDDEEAEWIDVVDLANELQAKIQ